MLRTRHRVAVYGPNGRGAQVELRILQRASAGLAVRAAEAAAAAEAGLGAIAYSVELNDADEETGAPAVLGRVGELP